MTSLTTLRQYGGPTYFLLRFFTQMLYEQGMQVELGTIPLYFCALYSIKRDNGKWGSKARANILGTRCPPLLQIHSSDFS